MEVYLRMVINTKELLENYPKLRLLDKRSRLHQMNGDLFIISRHGKIERITHGIVWRCKRKGKEWFELEVKKSELIDQGISMEEEIL